MRINQWHMFTSFLRCGNRRPRSTHWKDSWSIFSHDYRKYRHIVYDVWTVWSMFPFIYCNSDQWKVKTKNFTLSKILPYRGTGPIHRWNIYIRIHKILAYIRIRVSGKNLHRILTTIARAQNDTSKTANITDTISIEKGDNTIAAIDISSICSYLFPLKMI